MTILDKFKASLEVWHPTRNLPLVPIHNNPWIYSRYSMMCIGGDSRLIDSEFDDLMDRLDVHAENCETSPGVFDRDLGGSGGIFSWDEIIGIAGHFPWAAKRILEHLFKTDGVYINRRQDMGEGKTDRDYYVYRILCVKPFLRARAPGYRVGFFSQAQFALFILLDLLGFLFKGADYGGMLRIWTMLETMSQYWLSGVSVLIWQFIMHKRGHNPRRCFEHYLTRAKVFRETAPGRF